MPPEVEVVEEGVDRPVAGVLHEIHSETSTLMILSVAVVIVEDVGEAKAKVAAQVDHLDARSEINQKLSRGLKD